MDESALRMLQLAGQGFYCSQIVVMLALEMRGQENPGLVRALAGLAYGGGGGKGSCGAFTGACCLLGLFAGKGEAAETESPDLMLMLEELGDWFAARVGDPAGAITCAAVTGEDGPQAAREKCGRLVGDTFAQTLEILQAHGFDPQNP